MQETTQNQEAPVFSNTGLADAVFRPMLFSTPMVKALLDGSKTQTRRIVNPSPVIDKDSGSVYDGKLKSSYDIHNWKESFINDYSKCRVGDIIWVRETHTYHRNYWHYRADTGSPGEELRQEYIKSGCDSAKWKPSLFMPKEACRLFLKVTDVRIERLQNISEEDAISEGILKSIVKSAIFQTYLGYQNYCVQDAEDDLFYRNPIDSYESLWRKINGKDSWADNPFVFVYSFERVECPHGFR